MACIWIRGIPVACDLPPVQEATTSISGPAMRAIGRAITAT